MKRPHVLFIGDMKKDIGSSIVNKELFDAYKSMNNHAVSEIKYLDIFKSLLLCDVLHVGEISLKAVIFVLVAYLLRKKITYIMHAGINLSKSCNDYPMRSLFFEKILIQLSDKIFVPSNSYYNELKQEPFYKNKKKKYLVINNGLDVDKLCIGSYFKNYYKIITLGGGRREKGVLYICKAIEKLEMESLKLIVIGRDGPDTDKIKDYPFVEYLGNIPRDKMLLEMASSYLFIQNSMYETFSIALIEAYICKCKLISSVKVGANELFTPSLYKYNYFDSDALSKAIEKQLSNPVDYHLDLDKVSWKFIVKKYDLVWTQLCE